MENRRPSRFYKRGFLYVYSVSFELISDCGLWGPRRPGFTESRNCWDRCSCAAANAETACSTDWASTFSGDDQSQMISQYAGIQASQKSIFGLRPDRVQAALPLCPIWWPEGLWGGDPYICELFMFFFCMVCVFSPTHVYPHMMATISLTLCHLVLGSLQLSHVLFLHIKTCKMSCLLTIWRVT